MNRHDILACHGNVIRYLVMKALDVDTTAWPALSVAHCSLTVIEVTPRGTCRVLAIGDTGHIPPSLVSGYTRDVPELVSPPPIP
jgi:serine/threonine-protein phosphatase PGAM5